MTHKLVRVPRDKVEAWDEDHDAYGRRLGSSDNDDEISQNAIVDVPKALDADK